MTTELTTLRPNELEQVTGSLAEIKDNLATYTNEVLADTFGATKPLEKALKDLNEAARLELIQRKDEFGTDSKGNRMVMGERFGAKLTRRVTVKLLPDAPDALAEYAHLFEREFDPVAGESLLRGIQGLPEASYTRPVFSKEQLEKLVLAGQVPAEVALACLSEESVSWAATAVEPAKMKAS